MVTPRAVHLLSAYEPCHEIIELFVLRKLILQTPMRSHPVGLDSEFWQSRLSPRCSPM